MTETESPLLAEVHPALVSFLDAALVSEGEPALAQGLARLRFRGRCRCGPACDCLRTAPAARADHGRIHLDDEQGPRVWLQLDLDGTTFAGMEICAFERGPAPALDPDRPAGVG